MVAQRASVPSAVIQRMVDHITLDRWVEDGVFPVLQAHESAAKQREYHETVIMKEELLRRYQARENVDYDLVAAAVELANKNPINTTLTIRRAVTDAESQLNVESTAPLPPAPTTTAARFLQNLEDRRGSYYWASGRSKAFSAWISLSNPMASPLPTDAQINCWEAVFAAAAEAGLVAIQALRDAYQAQDAQTALRDDVFGPKVRGMIRHPADGPNNIASGDFILIAGSDGPLTHVVVTVGADPENYKRIPVMSLWGSIGGGGFVKTTLDRVLLPEAEFVYGSF
jgi:hypothetical protein